MGWGEEINGGFGMLLDGSAEADRRIRQMIHWDVNNGVARRSWAGNQGARHTAARAMAEESGLEITMPEAADEALVNRAIVKAYGE